MRERNKDEELKYAALKLIENLYEKGLIEKHIFQNILKEYGQKLDFLPSKRYNIA